MKLAARGFGLIRAFTGMSIPVSRYSIDQLSSSLRVVSTGVRDAIGWQPRFSLDEALRLSFGPLEDQ